MDVADFKAEMTNLEYKNTNKLEREIQSVDLARQADKRSVENEIKLIDERRTASRMLETEEQKRRFDKLESRTCAARVEVWSPWNMEAAISDVLASDLRKRSAERGSLRCSNQ